MTSTQRCPAPGPMDAPGFWLDSPEHRAWLAEQAHRQLAFFRASARGEGAGFHLLAFDGSPLPDDVQELHTVTRLIHSYALGHMCGSEECAGIVERGLDYLASHHLDKHYGGYVWAMRGDEIENDTKLTYGHAFVLLAAASAHMAGFERAESLLYEAEALLTQHYWQESPGLFADELARDWTPFSTYRGFNGNMHATEALLAAYEATGKPRFLARAGSILRFFTEEIAPANRWFIPEHYDLDWQINPEYAGNPMFRPKGYTPGHSFELARLLLQHWDLSQRPENGAPARARNLIEAAINKAWLPEGGFVYTLGSNLQPDQDCRFWWPVTEAVGALAMLIKLERKEEDERWYRKIWAFANTHFIDPENGGWWPEITPQGTPTNTIFAGKPDIYHSLQACLFPLAPGLSRLMQPAPVLPPPLVPPP